MPEALCFLVMSILRLSQTEIWVILLIFGSYFALVFTFQLILSYRLQRTCILGLTFILDWCKYYIPADNLDESMLYLVDQIAFNITENK